MRPVYHVAPTMRCSAPAKAFPGAVEALRYAREAADAYRVGYVVYRVLAGRLLRLAAFEPQPVRA